MFIAMQGRGSGQSRIGTGRGTDGGKREGEKADFQGSGTTLRNIFFF